MLFSFFDKFYQKLTKRLFFLPSTDSAFLSPKLWIKLIIPCISPFFPLFRCKIVDKFLRSSTRIFLFLTKIWIFVQFFQKTLFTLTKLLSEYFLGEGDRTYRGWGAGVCDRGGEADYERIHWNRLGQFLMRAICSAYTTIKSPRHLPEA